LSLGSRDQAIAASVALYTWYAFEADAGETQKAEYIHGMAHAATLDGSKNPALATDLVRAMDEVVTRDASPRPSSDYVYSISIDLCGSTDAKTRVRNNCRGNQQKIDEYNELIYRAFCQIEAKLFQGLVSEHYAGPAIDPRRLFTVKGIGDEMWSLCLTTEDNLQDTGRRLIDSAVSVANECINLAVPEHDDGGHFTPDFDYGNVEMVRSRSRFSSIWSSMPPALATFATRFCAKPYQTFGETSVVLNASLVAKAMCQMRTLLS